MSYLVLVRHSLPLVDPSMPAAQWHLSDEGRRRCAILADKLSAYDIDSIVSSSEPKAVETASIVAAILGKSYAISEGLHEHQRTGTQLTSREVFESGVADFFARPDQPVFGDETAEQAHTRFSEAVTRALASNQGKNIAIVAHGTVITLFVSRLTKQDPFTFWKQMELPSLVVLSVPDMKPVKCDFRSV